jgi:type II restriction enzyme
MSNSDLLRETSTNIGGGRSFFNEESKNIHKYAEIATDQIHKYLINKYPEYTFFHKKRITKMEIAEKLNLDVDYSPQSNSWIQPDGGVLFMKYKGKEYPILISEVKKQGTNRIRISEGKSKQGKGNAIERAFKNVSEFKCFCNDLDYFPYVIFACGCDFEEGSSILDRLDALTLYYKRNEIYALHKDQKVTVFVQPEYFSLEYIYSKLEVIVDMIVSHVTKE